MNVEVYLLIVIAIFLVLTPLVLLSIFYEIKETNNLLSDFLYHYHKYEGKK